MALDRYQRHVRWATIRALRDIGIEIRRRLKLVVGIPVERGGGEIFRSEPGEPPRKETGRLQASINYRIEDDPEGLEDLIIFTTSKHGEWLEIGTRYMEPRPWFFSTIRAMGDLKRLLKQKIVEYMRHPYESSEMGEGLHDPDPEGILDNVDVDFDYDEYYDELNPDDADFE